MEAERKMGEMLLATGNDGTRETRGGDRKSKLPEDTLKPTLTSLGLTKKESAQAQELASVPAEIFEDDACVLDKPLWIDDPEGMSEIDLARVMREAGDFYSAEADRE